MKLKTAEIINGKFTFIQDGKRIILSDDILEDAYRYQEHLWNIKEVEYQLSDGNLCYENIEPSLTPEQTKTFEDNEALTELTFSDKKLIQQITERMENFLKSEANGIDGEPEYNCYSYFSSCPDFNEDEIVKMITNRAEEISAELKKKMSQNTCENRSRK